MARSNLSSRPRSQPFREVEIGRRVACIGAGNTAIDVVTAARRLGAEIVYLDLPPRRGGNAGLRLRIPAREAGRASVFCGRRSPCACWARTASSPGWNACARELGAPDAKGRRSPAPVPGTRIQASTWIWSCAPWGRSRSPIFCKAVKGIELNQRRHGQDQRAASDRPPEIFCRRRLHERRQGSGGRGGRRHGCGARARRMARACRAARMQEVIDG